MPPKVELPYPTTDLVDRYIRQYERQQEVTELALAKLFHQYPSNSAREEVYLKVVAINSMYVTNIFDPSRVAEHISQLNIDDHVDRLLHEGKPEIVAELAKVQVNSERTITFYSFATKFCAWHNPAAYPIYDFYVDWILWEYRRQPYAIETYPCTDTRNYECFKQVITKFQESYGLSAYSFRNIDKFLWLAGKEYWQSGKAANK